jgi:hypothetical protein
VSELPEELFRIKKIQSFLKNLPNKARVDRLLNKVIDMSRLQVTDWLGKQ